MDDKIRQLLENLRFHGMANCFDELLIDATQKHMAHSDFFLSLLQAEHQVQKIGKFNNRLKVAKLPVNWTLETFPFEKQPLLNRCQINNLSKLDFIKTATNLSFIGKPGTGKTGLAIGLLHLALLNGYRGRFYNAQNLFDELYASLADQTTTKVLKRLSRYDVLLIDGLGYSDVNIQHANMLFKVIDMRYQKKATIITSCLDYAGWYPIFKNKDWVDAMLDRFCHNCVTIKIDGSSLRASAESLEDPVATKDCIS